MAHRLSSRYAACFSMVCTAASVLVASALNTSAATASETTTLGTAPEEKQDIRRVFLRKETVLLNRGEIEIESGLQYERARRDALTVLGPLTRRFKLPVNARIGLCKNVEAFVSVPLVHSYREFSEGETEEDQRVVSVDSTDLGDVQGGVSIVLRRETLNVPEIVASILVQAPTGTDPYEDGGRVASTGSGHWGIQGAIQFVSTSDPIVLYGGLQLGHEFEEEGLDQDIQPGAKLGYNFGMGFAVNDEVSLSAQLQGHYQAEVEIDGQTIDGSSLEPISLRLGITRRWGKQGFLEPSVNFGINDDAPDVVLGLAVIRRFSP